MSEYKLKFFYLLALSLILGGCGTSNFKTEWSCPASQPEGCLNIEDADKIAMENLTKETIGENSRAPLWVRRPMKSSTQETIISKPKTNGDIGSTITTKSFGNVRIPEKLAEVWLGPFQDEKGNYHPATRMIIVVKPAQWRLP